MLLFSFYRLVLFFTDFCQTNYLNINRTDLHQCCTDGKTIAVDEIYEVFPEPSSLDVGMAINFCWVGFINRTVSSGDIWQMALGLGCGKKCS